MRRKRRKERRISHRTQPWSTAKRELCHRLGRAPASGQAGGDFGRCALLASELGASYCALMRLQQLDEHLQRYVPADATEASFLNRMRLLCASEAACSRGVFEPGHFTASAFVLSPDRREIVMIHHKKLGIWVQPGGHIDDGDVDLVSAARREVLEEVGLAELEPLGAAASPLFDLDIHRIPARKAEAAHEHFDVRFAFVAQSRELVRSAEVNDLRWVQLATVEQLATDDSVLRAVNKLRALLSWP